MSDQFLGEIRAFGGNFAPFGWALCNGQLLPISQNTALFSLLGNNYGGDGKVTFGLPNLQGSVPIHQGTGPGLTPRVIGEVGGSSTVALIAPEMPTHTHLASCSSISPQTSPVDGYWGSLGGRTSVKAYAQTLTEGVPFWPLAAAPAGGNVPHNNMQPYLAVTFIIALQGIFPRRP